jgi:hypothetical protein
MKALDFYRWMLMVLMGAVMLVMVTVTFVIPVIMIMVGIAASGMIVDLASPSLLSSCISRPAEKSNRITKTGHPPFDHREIAAVVLHSHRARHDGNGDIRDAGDAPIRGVDLGRAGSAVHAANPVFRLCRFSHDPFPC